MTKRFLKGGATALAAVSMLGLVATSGGATAAAASSKPVEGGNILLDSTGTLKDLDPALAYDGYSYEAVTEMYDQLVTYKGATSDIIPMAAQSYTISKDGKTYTFHIRKGVKFWDGTPLTAQSFIDEFQRVLSSKLASPGEGFADPIIVGSTAYNQGKAKTVTGLSAPNPYTLVIKLNNPEPFFLEILAMPFFSAVDQAYINKVGNKNFDASTAMGTGPFELQSDTGTQVVLTKNPHYWMKDKYGQSLPYLDKITIRVNQNGTLDALNYEQGKTAILGNIIGIPSTAYPHFETDPTLKKEIVQTPLNQVYYLGLNSTQKPFNNVKVRRALEYAINRKKIVQLINGRGQIADQPLTPGIKGYVNKLAANASYSYNPAKAKQLLKAAGYPNGFSTTLYTANDPDTIKLVTSIQNDLAQVGVKAKIAAYDWSVFLGMKRKGNLPMFELSWGEDFPDASDFLDVLFNTNEQPQNNAVMFSNKKVDALLNKAQVDNNQAERLKLYGQATNLIMSQAPWIPLYYPLATYAAQPWVHGFYINPTLSDPLQYMWIDPGHSQN